MTATRNGARVGPLRLPCLPLFLVLAPALCLPLAAAAETLPDVLAAARALNPRIDSARARSLASDETVVQAKAGFLPSITAHGDAAFQTDARAPSFAAGRSVRPAGGDVTLSQPLFDGGRAAGALGSATATSGAEKENVHLVEQQVLLAAATAYLDVVQDRRILKLNRDAHVLLTQTAQATRRRVAAQEATIADAAQADAAVANAMAQIELARANLEASEAAFEEAVTHPPAELERPPGIDGLLPASRQAALAIAERESPALSAAALRVSAARHAVAQAQARLLPTVSVQAAYQRRTEAATVIGDNDGLVAKVVVSVPLYTGGSAASEVREARHILAAEAYLLADARAQTRTSIAQAWSRMSAARAALQSIKAVLAANRTALDGIRAEQRMGQRSVLDVINAQQAVLTSQTAHEQLTRNMAVASYGLLAVTGRLSAMADAEAQGAPSGPADKGRADWNGTITRTNGR
jgi:outer membrane protein